MQLIIVGCGRAGAQLANKMSRAGNVVTVVDVAPDAFLNLAGDFRGHILQAEALNRDVLVNAGIETADAVAALTNSDALNAVLGHIATTVYHVPRVVVRSYDPAWLPMHAVFGLQTVSSVEWGTERFAELLQGNSAVTGAELGDGSLVLAELAVASACDGMPLADVRRSFAGVVAAVVKNGHSQLPTDNLVLAAGDTLVVSATHADATRLRQVLEGKEGTCTS